MANNYFGSRTRERSNSKGRTGNTYIDKNDGYPKFKDSNKPVHRWVAEKKLNRKLKAGEVVHHKNRNKLDNSPSNLAIFSSQKKHWEVHKQDAKKHGWKYSMIGKKTK
ncbi:MAG: HNH endonuclease [Treponema sp.]|jgi:uncharacterized FlgJ-related protein|nr:HNH endonuclease [Treponema sp.]